MNFMKIVVIEAFGLHLGYLGCYGNDWVATPNLDRLATEGVVFDWHIVDQPDLHATTPWHERSVGTGRYAPPGRSTPAALPIVPRVVRCESLTTFGEDASRIVSENDTWLWIEGPSLLPPWRFDAELLDAYFDEDDVDEGLSPWTDPPFDLVELNDAEVLQLQNTYAAVVTLFDAQLGGVLDRIGEDVLVCVTARSGLPLGEHGMIGAPRPLLHDELVHVPLLMRLPGRAEAGTRVAALTQHVDLAPTFLGALSRESAASGSQVGMSHWPLIRGQVDALRPFAVSFLRVGEHESWLLRTPTQALHVPIAPDEHVKPQLFLKPEDRWEVNDLFQQQLETAEELTITLRTFVENASA